MGRRLSILALLTIAVLAIEILFLHNYENTFVVSYESLAGEKVARVSADKPLSFSKSYPDPNMVKWDEVAEVLPPSVDPESVVASESNNNPNINNMNNNSHNNAPSKAVSDPKNNIFATQPTYNLDFTGMSNGTPVSNYFRIQNGIDDHWNPSWNNERQMYRPQNVKIENGNLVIEARVESNGEISAGKVDTQGFFEAKYGKFEITAKMPSGIGTFPAIWMLSSAAPTFRNNIATPQEKALDISWQGDGEIDIMEFLGAEPGYIFHDAHTFRTLLNGNDIYSKTVRLSTVSSAYHVYGVEWTPDYVAYTVDGVRTSIIRKNSEDIRDWPFNTHFYLILNLAMGGDWNDAILRRIGQSYPNGINNADQGNWKMYVKSIKHYSLL